MPTDGNSGEQQQQTQQTEQKVTFTPEQQVKVNELIRDAMGRAGSEHRERAAQLETELSNMRKEIDSLRERSSAANKSGDKGAKNELDAQIAEMRQAHQALQEESKRFKQIAEERQKEVENVKQEAINTRKQWAISQAASKHNFIDPTVVAKLTGDSIRYDEKNGRFVVYGDNGQERLNSQLNPMTLDEYYTEFASKNPYLVRSDARSGLGSTENRRFDVSNNGKYQVTDIFGPKSSSRKAMDLYKENPAEYHRLKEIAREQGLIYGAKKR